MVIAADVIHILSLNLKLIGTSSILKLMSKEAHSKFEYNLGALKALILSSYINTYV